MSNEDKTIFSFIKLPEQEIEGKTGVFLNPKTGHVWELSIKDGKLIVDVPNYSFQIAPLSNTKFTPLNSQVNIEFEFEKQGQNAPLLMHLYAKGIQRATFEASQVGAC
jgi:type II secretory pathway component PulC